MATNIELYEALKGRLGEKAARMLADSVPMARDLATRADVGALRTDVEGLRTDVEGLRTGLEGLRSDLDGFRASTKAEIQALRGEMRVGFEQLRAEIKGSESSLMRWMLTFFVPLWLGTWGTILAIVLKA